MTKETVSESAATDVAEFIGELDGGTLERMLSVALSQTAAAVIDNGRKGCVTLKLEFEQIPNTYQVQITHTLTAKRPTSRGNASEDESRDTVFFVGKFGALAITQAPLFSKQENMKV